MIAVPGKKLKITGFAFPFAVLANGYEFHDSSLLQKVSLF
jgi:hypothetical protein